MTESSGEEINFDLERMKKAIEGPYRTMPTGLTREELREWMLKVVEETRANEFNKLLKRTKRKSHD